jgi:osmoprotectant transport system substrate-binding protein
MLALGALLLALLGACSTGGGSKPTIKIGSDDFYEAKIVGEIYAQALEASGYGVDRAGFGLGGRDVSAPALESGQIDLKPEYIGSGVAHYDPSKQSGDPAAEKAALQAILAGKGGGITVLDYASAADQNGFVVRAETASQFNLTKLSDLTQVQDQIKFGLALQCPTNPVCGPALMSAYGFTQQTIDNATLLAACSQPMVDALAAKTIDLGELCTTQPDIAKNGWVLLTDDKSTQPADNLVPLVRNDYLAKVDRAAFSKILNDVSAKLTTPGLLDLNRQFVFDKKEIADIAKGWLTQNGFLH